MTSRARVGFVLGCMALGLALPAGVTDITLTINDGTYADDGLCLLREAVEAANTDAAVFTMAGRAARELPEDNHVHRRTAG